MTIDLNSVLTIAVLCNFVAKITLSKMSDTFGFPDASECIFRNSHALRTEFALAGGRCFHQITIDSEKSRLYLARNLSRQEFFYTLSKILSSKDQISTMYDSSDTHSNSLELILHCNGTIDINIHENMEDDIQGGSTKCEDAVKKLLQAWITANGRVPASQYQHFAALMN